VAADENIQTTSQQASKTHIISLARNAMDLGKQHSVPILPCIFISGDAQALLGATATFTSATCHSLLSDLKVQSHFSSPCPSMRAP